jgi:hypothetical protein
MALDFKFADRRTPRNRNEPSRTAKNLQKSQQRNCRTTICRLQNASSCNKRTHQNADLQSEGAAVLAPHGAFRSAAPCLWQGWNGVLRSLSRFCKS